MTSSSDRGARNGDSLDEVVDADGLHHSYGDRSHAPIADGTVEVLTVGGKTERIWKDVKDRG